MFFNNQVEKPASVLSGGELARLALAMITISQIDVLVLDEPTDNLDLETVEQIAEALTDYQGAMIVIAHDIDFLSRINITKAFKIKNNKLESTMYLPEDEHQYYQELLN